MTEMENEFPTIEEGEDETAPPEPATEAPAQAADAVEEAEPLAPVDEAPSEAAEPEAEPDADAEVLPEAEALSDAEAISDAEMVSDAEAISEAEIPKDESKVRRFFRLFVRWTLGLLIVFGLGFLAALWTLYQPEVRSKYELQNQLQSEQQAAQAQISGLEDQIGSLETQIDDLQSLATENEQLLAAQDEFELHIAILDARLDVSNALLALAVDDPARARVSLEKTGAALARISILLPAVQRDVVASMEHRLELALEGMEDAAYAAQSDLDVLAKSLLEMEDGLFGSP